MIRYYYLAHKRCADVAELADALDSGSSGHCARAGSSPVIRSNADKVIGNDDLFLCVKARKGSHTNGFWKIAKSKK